MSTAVPPLMQHGEGTKRFPDGSEHSGRWRAGNRDGPGVFIDARGQKTVGNFRDDAFGKAEEDGIVAPVRLGWPVDIGRGYVMMTRNRLRAKPSCAETDFLDVAV